MTETPPTYDGKPVAPVPKDEFCDDSRRRKALETLRRSLISASKQVEELIDIEQRHDVDAPPRPHHLV